jgi:hypothetical protein
MNLVKSIILYCSCKFRIENLNNKPEELQYYTGFNGTDRDIESLKI